MDSTAGGIGSPSHSSEPLPTPTSATLSDGLTSALRPAVERIQASYTDTLQSQAALLQLTKQLQQQLQELNGQLPTAPDDIQVYVHRIADIRRRITAVERTLSVIYQRLLRVRAQWLPARESTEAVE